MPKGPSGIRADRGYSHQELELLAAHVREKLKSPPTSAINALRLFDGLDILVRDRAGQDIPIRGVVVDLEDTEGFSKYDSDRRVIEIRASAETYDWLERGYPRAGYFVAHELGHCFLHTDLLVRLAQMPAVQRAALHGGGQLVAHEFYRDTEWQANAFASALLMPAHGLLALEQQHRDGLCPTKIAEHFHVSVEAASYRLELYNNRKQQLLQARPEVALDRSGA